MDRGKLLYRSEEGVQARTRRLKRMNRISLIIDLIWVGAFAILVLVYLDFAIFLLLTIGILQFLDAFLSRIEIRKDCPMVEVYEMGVFDRALHWPWKFSYFFHSRTALSILVYPVHRQMLPPSASLMSSSEGSGLRCISA